MQKQLQKNNKLLKSVDEKLKKYCGVTSKKCVTPELLYKALALSVVDIVLVKKRNFNANNIAAKRKKVYYLCMEFLIGRNLKNSLFNLGLLENARQVTDRYSFDLDDIFELENDPGLGNGGLGRLAACFMDSLASLDYPAMGFCLKYDYGLFKQKIVENQQVELADKWLDTGEVFINPKIDKSFKVSLGGTIRHEHRQNKIEIFHENATEILATAHDILIAGCDSNGVSNLRLWKANTTADFDIHSFNSGDYLQAVRKREEAEALCKVLYPNDSEHHGKQLRLSQQYFLVCASLQSIIKDHIQAGNPLNRLADFAAIHINDTHPALAIPELMRLLLDEYGFSWEQAFDITQNCMAYTNHTVLVEALESWDESLFARLLPRIYQIILEIDRRFCLEFDGDKLDNMRIIKNGRVYMANLCVIGSHSVNGVSALHSSIIKDTIFNEFNSIMPDKFTNVTNGIAYRRWLNQSNPRLADLIAETIGDKFIKDASHLNDLLKYKDDNSMLEKLAYIKQQNKIDFSNYAGKNLGLVINPNSRFDVQVKRLHEYKRQLLNVLKIIDKFLFIKDNPNVSVTSETFIFGAKAAGSYTHAKRIIQLINCLASEIDKDSRISKKLKVAFVENYNVSKAERIFASAEVSQQISLAGKEASGTGNMKFMLNGALTVGTVDGANVEIADSVGENNIFLFGLRANEVQQLFSKGYHSLHYYASNQKLHRIIEALRCGFDGEKFSDIANYLLIGTYADPYGCIVDFDDYLRACNKMDTAYQNKYYWNRSSLINIARAGHFSSDRSIKEYAESIWKLQ